MRRRSAFFLLLGTIKEKPREIHPARCETDCREAPDPYHPSHEDGWVHISGLGPSH